MASFTEYFFAFILCYFLLWAGIRVLFQVDPCDAVFFCFGGVRENIREKQGKTCSPFLYLFYHNIRYFSSSAPSFALREHASHTPYGIVGKRLCRCPQSALSPSSGGLPGRRGYASHSETPPEPPLSFLCAPPDNPAPLSSAGGWSSCGTYYKQKSMAIQFLSRHS